MYIIIQTTKISLFSRISLVALYFQFFITFTKQKKASTISSMVIGNAEHKSVSQTLAHWNSKIEIRQRNRGSR